MLCCYGATTTTEKKIFIVALRKALGEAFVITFGSFWRVIID